MNGRMHSSTQDECKSILRSSVFQPRLQLKILQTIDFDKKVGFSRFYFSPGGRNVFAGPILFQLDKINYFQRTFQNKIVALKLTISDQKYWCFFHGNGISTPGGNVACLRDPNLKVASPWATRLLNTPTKPVLVFFPGVHREVSEQEFRISVHHHHPGGPVPLAAHRPPHRPLQDPALLKVSSCLNQATLWPK